MGGPRIVCNVGQFDMTSVHHCVLFFLLARQCLILQVGDIMAGGGGCW